MAAHPLRGVQERLTAAQSVTNKIATSQISLATDNVFSDAASLELSTVTGDGTNGMTATLTVAV